MGIFQRSLLFIGFARAPAVKHLVELSFKHCSVNPVNYFGKQVLPICSVPTSFYSNIAMSVHIKARCELYPRTKDIKRFAVPEDKVPWSVDFPEYSPIEYTSAGVLAQPVWADNPDPTYVLSYNVISKF